jgi:hypothetical protein
LEEKAGIVNTRRQELFETGRTSFNDGFIQNNGPAYYANIGTFTNTSVYTFDTFEMAHKFLLGYQDVSNIAEFADTIRYGKDGVEARKKEKQEKEIQRKVKELEDDKARYLRNIEFDSEYNSFMTIGARSAKTKQELIDKINAEIDSKIAELYGKQEATLEEKIDFFSKDASNELKQVLVQSVQNNLINLDC